MSNWSNYPPPGQQQPTKPGVPVWVQITGVFGLIIVGLFALSFLLGGPTAVFEGLARFLGNLT